MPATLLDGKHVAQLTEANLSERVASLKANTDDMDEEEAATNLGKKFKSNPWGFFKVVITIIFGAIAVTQLIEVW